MCLYVVKVILVSDCYTIMVNSLGLIEDIDLDVSQSQDDDQSQASISAITTGGRRTLVRKPFGPGVSSSDDE